jgi:predicted solute-binding protein
MTFHEWVLVVAVISLLHFAMSSSLHRHSGVSITTNGRTLSVHSPSRNIFGNDKIK